MEGGKKVTWLSEKGALHVAEATARGKITVGARKRKLQVMEQNAHRRGTGDQHSRGFGGKGLRVLS